MAKRSDPHPAADHRPIPCPEADDVESLREQLEIQQLVLDSIHHGVMVTDTEGYITHFNKPYGRFLGLEPTEQIGKHYTAVVENTRMHIVARTGTPEINRSHRVKGQSMVVQRIPIKKGGEVIAVFGQVMFKDVRDVRKLADKLSVLESKVEMYEQELLNLRSTRYTFDSIIGRSERMRLLKAEALRAATNSYPVLITGESGTGKELFAQAIHHASERKLYPFVRINCAAIPKDLLESELFGYEQGAFTGARAKGKPGKFELAQNGTIFLDEIGDLALEMQPKLLRVIEDKEFERIGGTKVIRSNFRIIAATNQNLDEMMQANCFRKDLYYRLNVIPIHIPPLRERPQDISVLADQFLKEMAAEANLDEKRMDKTVADALPDYDWPGNARELRNVFERVLASMVGGTIHLGDLPFYVYQDRKKTDTDKRGALKGIQQRAEREAIIYTLQQTDYNKVQAAKILGIHRTLLYKKMKQYQIPLGSG